MKILRYQYQGNKQYGILEGARIYPITATIQDIRDLIDYDFSKVGKEDSFKIEDVKVISPMDEPVRNVFCVGKNYLEHVNEVKGTSLDKSIPQKPIYFTKAVDYFKTDKDMIEISSLPTNELDYEVELAIIIGKTGKNITKEKAKDYVFGYMVANDFSARDLQRERGQWFKGKSLDGLTAIGPLITLKDEVEFPPKLKITSTVNGELRQNNFTDNLIFSIDTIIEDLSNGMTLKKGDIILTGTPSGVGAGFEPPKYLQKGDVVELEIEKIGVLRNTMS